MASLAKWLSVRLRTKWFWVRVQLQSLHRFFSFARKFEDKYGKKLIDTATKTGIDPVKTASKRVVQKNAEATRGLIGNKIADKITSVGKTKEKEKENTNKPEEIYIPPEKKQQIIDNLKLF